LNYVVISTPFIFLLLGEKAGKWSGSVQKVGESIVNNDTIDKISFNTENRRFQ